MDDTDLKNWTEMTHELENLKITIAKKQQTIDSLYRQQQMGKEIINELQVFFPEIKGITISPEFIFYNNNQKKELTLVIIDTGGKTLTSEAKNTLHSYLKSRTKTQNIKIITLENDNQLFCGEEIIS